MMANRLVVAVDLGTTYTGVAFCETSDIDTIEKNIEVVQDWPSCHTRVGTKVKVPTEVAYTAEGIIYGSNIAPNIPRHLWTKLELDAPQLGEAAKILSELSLAAEGPKKKAVDIIADFLSEVKGHLITNLDRRYGKELWRTLPITLVVTVPAVWSDAAKDRTQEAFSKAGFNVSEFPQLKRTITITEPEAAALYTIQSLRGSVQDEQFAVGDGFIVCDMGGGTVDLISYRVAELEPTILEEATVGGGDQCGGTFVDRAFLRWLERRLGTTDFVKIAGNRSEELPRTSLSPKLSRMLQDFVLEAKSGFSGTQNSYMRLPPPLSSIEEDSARGIVDGEIQVLSDDMKDMFEYSLRRTYELLLEQMRQARRGGKVRIKYIVLVGGFAESPYIYEKLQTFAEANGIEAIRPPNAWSSIVQGAVVKGLEGSGRAQIKNRKCRRSYGTDFSSLFVMGKHRETDGYICPYTGVKRAHCQMDWMLKKGRDLAGDTECHAKVSFVRNFWSLDRREASIDLLATDANKAPSRSKDKGVYTVATLNVDLSSVPRSAYTMRWSSTGSAYYELIFEVQICVQSSLEYSFWIEGVRYGSVIAKYT